VVKKSANERYLDGSPDGLRRDCEESLKTYAWTASTYTNFIGSIRMFH
jgi:hypothetical protein